MYQWEYFLFNFEILHILNLSHLSIPFILLPLPTTSLCPLHATHTMAPISRRRMCGLVRRIRYTRVQGHYGSVHIRFSSCFAHVEFDSVGTVVICRLVGLVYLSGGSFEQNFFVVCVVISPGFNARIN